MFARKAMRHMQAVQTEQELKSQLIRTYTPDKDKLNIIKKEIDEGIVDPFWKEFYYTWESTLERKLETAGGTIDRQGWLNQISSTGFQYPFFTIDADLLKWSAKSIPKDPTQFKLPYPQTTINVGNFKIHEGNIQIINLAFTCLQADKTNQIFVYIMMEICTLKKLRSGMVPMNLIFGVPIHATFQEYMDGVTNLFGNIKDPSIDVLHNDIMPLGTAMGLVEFDTNGIISGVLNNCFDWLAGFLALVNLKRGIKIKNESSVQPKKNKKGIQPKGYSFHILVLEQSLKEEFEEQRKFKFSGNRSEGGRRWVRGHFKTFTPEAPLFGTIVGVIWWPAHQRGKEGFIDKEYVVK